MNMGQRHKHADVIIAWANGAEIEGRDTPTSPWTRTRTPSWYENYEYRIKPPEKKYKVALYKDSFNGNSYTVTADIQKDVEFYEKEKDFVRWLTDWIEYEE